MPKIHSINVRALAEFALQKGDLVPSARQLDRMNEGMRGHKQLQSMLGEGWRAEEPVARDFTVGGVTLRVQGRADAVRDGVSALCAQYPLY